MSDQPKAYNPSDHLVKIKTKNGEVDYYPAAWRLYELNRRYPTANFRSDILHLDVERNFVIVKCTLYLGSSADLDRAERKTEALKQGALSALDKVETAAKARCARDLGISTELALDLEDDPVSADTVPDNDSTSTQPVEQPNGHRPLDPALKARLNQCYLQAKKLGLCTDAGSFLTYVTHVATDLPAGRTLPPALLTPEHLATVERRLQGLATEQAARQEPIEPRTLGQVRAFFAQTYCVKPATFQATWHTFCTQVLGHALPDEQLTAEHLTALNAAISQDYQQTFAAKMLGSLSAQEDTHAAC